MRIHSAGPLTGADPTTDSSIVFGPTSHVVESDYEV